MFHRSRCFQRIAVDERDSSLCKEVKERKAWLFDGSGFSEESCRELVAKRIAKDHEEAKAKDFSAIYRLKSIRFFRNGNGEDFDLKVVSEGAFAGRYELELILSRSGLTAPLQVHQQTYGYAANDSTRWVFLRHGELAERLGNAFAEVELTVSVTLRLARTAYNRFYYDLIPVRFASSELTTSVTFASLSPKTPRLP